jgi:hypothetical protein
MKSFLAFAVLLSLFFTPHSALAETEKFVVKKDHIYEKPTMEELSKLYWLLGALDLNNDTAIDNYLLINECGIYQEYRNNEFEWKNIRESTRTYLKDNYTTFAHRLEFLQPLYLGEYNIDKEYFEIIKDYVKPTSRRLEVLTKAHMAPVCEKSGEIEGYPKGILVELTRPFGIDKIPVPKDKAQPYIDERLEEFNKLPEYQRTDKRLLESRDAYIWMQIRVFGYKGVEKIEEGYGLNTVFAVLEGVEVYADRDRKDLLYKENFDFYKEPSEFEQRLRDQYQAMMSNELIKGPDIQDQAKGLGLLHIAEKIVAARKQPTDADKTIKPEDIPKATFEN